MTVGSNPWPTDLVYERESRRLTVTFDDGLVAHLPAELLRVRSPSAEVRGHGGGPGETVPGKRLVTIERMEPVGQYAVRLIFSDGHDSGLFSWSYLHELASNQPAIWQAYLADLAAKGLGR